MEQYFLAIDIGASGGRHILGHLEDGRLVLEEIYRFENGMEEIDGQKCWNVERLFEEINRYEAVQTYRENSGQHGD